MPIHAPFRRRATACLSLGPLVCGACAVLATLVPAHAQNSAPPQSGYGRALAPARLFRIAGFDIDDQAGLSPAALAAVQQALDAYLGSQRTVADVTAARLAAQAVLEQAEPGQVAVNVPEQTLQDQRVKVVVARAPQAVLGKVQASAAGGFSAENVLAAVPALREGSALDATALDRQLRLGELNPFKRTNVTLARQADGTPQAMVNAQAERSQLFYLSADNYGPRDARGRLGAGYINGNLTGRDDVLSLNYVTAFDPQRMKGLTASYALPLYRYGQMLEFSVARSESDSANTVELFHINGTGTAASAKWSYLLPRWGDANLRLTAGYLYHRARNNVTFNALAGTGSLLPSGATAPLSVGLEGEVRPGGLPAVVRGGVSLSHNFAGQLGSTDSAGLSALRQGAGSFTVASGRVQADAEVAGGWQLRGIAQGQYTQDILTAADQLNIAGPYAVRGMRDAGVLGDKALALNAEAATPVLANVSDVALRGWGFADWGTVRRNGALAGELASANLASTGAGVRAAAPWGTAELYLAHKISGMPLDAYKSRNSVWLTATVRF